VVGPYPPGSNNIATIDRNLNVQFIKF